MGHNISYDRPNWKISPDWAIYYSFPYLLQKNRLSITLKTVAIRDPPKKNKKASEQNFTSYKF